MRLNRIGVHNLEVVVVGGVFFDRAEQANFLTKELNDSEISWVPSSSLWDLCVHWNTCIEQVWC